MFSYSHPSPETTVFVIVDMQERLLSAMDQADVSRIIARQKIMINAARELQIPLIVTEQYPKGLGKTVAELSALFQQGDPILEKTSFSCFGDLGFRKEIERRHFKSMVIMGVETHVCIQQTAIDALHRGFQVFLPVDALNSRNNADASVSIELMRHMEIYATTVESVIFSIMRDASHPAFKKVVGLLK